MLVPLLVIGIIVAVLGIGAVVLFVPIGGMSLWTRMFDDSGDALVREYIAMAREVIDEIEKIQDINSALAFKAKEETLKQRVLQAEAKIKQLPGPQQDRLRQKYAAEIAELQGKMAAQFTRLMQLATRGLQQNPFGPLAGGPDPNANNRPNPPVDPNPGIPNPPPGFNNPGPFRPGAGRPGFPIGPGGGRPGPGDFQNADAARQQHIDQMKAQYGAERVVTIIIKNLPAGHDLFDGVVKKLVSYNPEKNGGHNAYTSPEGVTVIIAPIADIQAFAKMIDFGTTSVDAASKTITLTADHDKVIVLAKPSKRPDLPGRPKKEVPEDADPVTRALAGLDETDHFGCIAALERLAVLKVDEKMQDKVIKAITPLCTVTDVFIRAQAIKTLGFWGNKETVPDLLRLLEHNDHGVVNAAIGSLARLKDERAIEPIAKAHLNFFARKDAAEALEKFGGAAEPAVLKTLAQAELFTKKEVCTLLGKIGTTKSIPALTAITRSTDNSIKFHVSGAARAAIDAINSRK
jgi:hypothetical protein